MKRMQSPTPNRKGVREVHDVPDRKVANLVAKGWTEVLPGASDKPKESAGTGQPMEPTKGPLTESLNERPVFDMGGSWMKVRSQIKEALGLEKVPKNKDEARVLLEDAGYEVR